MRQIIACTLNFSEGINLMKIELITDEINHVRGVRLINSEPAKGINRTSLTLAGYPQNVVEAAFLTVKKAALLIDMREQRGTYPRMGSTDVVTLIPINDISLEETIVYSRNLAKRIGKELSIPVYCYGNSAYENKRKDINNCRRGEYEGLQSKIKDKKWRPDFGPSRFNDKISKTGATIIGAGIYPISYSVNLNTSSVVIAKEIAEEIRENKRLKLKTIGITNKSKIVENENPEYEPGLLKSVKAIGWINSENGIAQISCDLTDTRINSLFQVYEAASSEAIKKGVKVTGSEIKGFVPLEVLLEAGRCFFRKENKEIPDSVTELINKAVTELSLNSISPFIPEEKIFENFIKDL